MVSACASLCGLFFDKYAVVVTVYVDLRQVLQVTHLSSFDKYSNSTGS